MAKTWYAYTGFKSNDHFDIENYGKITMRHECLCGPLLCAIYATEDGKYPVLSPNIRQYINDALVTGQIQPDIPFVQKYVYLKH